MQIEKYINNNVIELSILDKISGLEIVKVNITKDDFFNMFIKNHGIVKVDGEFFEKNIGNMGKTRDFIRVDYPYGVDRKEFIKNNTPEGYEYWSDCNYGKTANFIRFI